METYKRTAPVSKIIQISERMYNQGMKDLERKKARVRNPEEPKQQLSSECTFRPNIKKNKFVKYPNPPKIKLEEDTVFEETFAEPDQQRPSKKIAPPRRLNLFYDWMRDRNNRIVDDFIQKEISKSLETRPVARNNTQPRKLQRILHERVDLNDLGVQEHCKRLRMARLMKQETEFLLQNPTVHTWNFTPSAQTKMDSNSTYFMSMGDDLSRSLLV